MHPNRYTGKRPVRTADFFCGVAAVIGVQSFINIAVVTKILPNTGTPLPFVSYGLTSMVSLYIGMGLVLNVGLQKYRTYREVEPS